MWRRPLSAQEVSRYMAFYEEQPDATQEREQAIGLLATMMSSPNAIYEIRYGGESEARAPQRRALTGRELAHRLYLTLRQELAPHEVVAAFEAAEAHSPERLREAHVQEVERLLSLSQQESLHTAQRFVRQWLGLAALEDAGIDLGMKDPEQARQTMLREVDLMVQAQWWREPEPGQEADPAALLLAPSTQVESYLERFYLPLEAREGAAVPVESGAWRELAFEPGHERLGVLTTAAVLGAHAMSSDTAIIHRGVFLYRQMFCREPYGVSELSPELQAQIQQAVGQIEDARQASRQRRSDTANQCAGCHQLFDPMGLALEGYDREGALRKEEVSRLGALPQEMARAVGLWQEEELGWMSDEMREQWPAEAELSGGVELARAIAENPEFSKCYVQKLYVFTLQQQAPAGDAMLEALADRVQRREISFRELWQTLLTSEAFTTTLRASDAQD